MDARQVDEVSKTLRDLRALTIEDLALSGTAFAGALVASQTRPSLAVPFFLGAMGMAFLGLRAYLRRAVLVQLGR